MNPAHIGYGLTALGFIVNAVWTVANIRAENRIVRRLDAIKADVARHYVTQADCDARHGHYCRLASLASE